MSNEALKIVPQGNFDQTGSDLPRLAGNPSGEGFSQSRLENLLGDIDGVKREIHESMRRIDAVREAKSLRTDESRSTEILNSRLAEMTKLVNALKSESSTHVAAHEDSETVRAIGRDINMAEARVMSNRIAGEGVAIAWPKSEGLQQHPDSGEDRTLGYESASRRLEEAERLQREIAEMSAYAKLRMDKAELALAEARVREEAAASDLLSARQELTTAYQFASVAAQRRLESSEFFERTARWAVFASLFSWIATVWLVWIALLGFHQNTSIFMPIFGTVVLVLGGTVLIKRRVRSLGDR